MERSCVRQHQPQHADFSAVSGFRGVLRLVFQTQPRSARIKSRRGEAIEARAVVRWNSDVDHAHLGSRGNVRQERPR